MKRKSIILIFIGMAVGLLLPYLGIIASRDNKAPKPDLVHQQIKDGFGAETKTDATDILSKPIAQTLSAHVPIATTYRAMERLLELPYCSVCGEMAFIPAGKYMMGSAFNAQDRNEDEAPRHLVNVAAFEIGRTEVTQAQWRAVMGRNPSFFKTCGDTCPVENISWNDIAGAQGFFAKLNRLTHQTYRLPTEAEWEYACKANQVAKYCGGDQLQQLAWTSDNSRGRAEPAASMPKGANAWGLFDMSGNVGEWIQDCWHDTYFGAPTMGSNWDGGDCTRHVVRGGSWLSKKNESRATSRLSVDAGDRTFNLGFRIARSIPK